MIGTGLVLTALMKTGMAEKTAKKLVWPAIIVVGCLLLYGGWQLLKWSIISDYNNEANAEFAEDFDEATGKADLASGDRKAEHDARIKTTKELIDEAEENGCAVGEYLATALDPGGPVCVSDNPKRRP